MSAASPEDLVIAFRSVTRRLHEAQGVAAAEVTASPTGELHGLLREAGSLMGTANDPAAIADAIHAVHPDEWDSSVLDRLRAIALELGRLLRHITDLADRG